MVPKYNKKIINVLHVIETLDAGGAESIMTEMIRNMPPFIMSNVCCLKKSGIMSNRLTGYVGNIYELDKKEGNDLSIALKLSKVIKKENIDILHSHNWNTYCECVFAASLSNKPIIHTIHGHHFLYPQTKYGAFKKRIRHFLEKLLSYKSSKICVVSNDIYHYIRKNIGIKEKKLSIIFNGVDTNYKPNDPKVVMKSMGIENDDFIICFCGRLMPVKNVESIIVAMKSVVLQCKRAKLVIIGEGPERTKLESSVAEKGLQKSVVFFGYRNDVRDILTKVDIFVLSSHYEGISISLLEAMAAGLPSIATDVGGNNETILDKKTGFLYPSGDSEILSNYIIKLYKDISLRKNMSVNARNRAIQYFSITAVARRYAEQYVELTK